MGTQAKQQGQREQADTALADAEARLRAAAVRITAARVKVLATLLRARSACSHQDLQDALGEMDRVTLYRALDCLADAGLAHKIAGDDRVFRYSAGAGSEHAADAPHHQHGHFKCLGCARVYCLDSVAEPEALQDTMQKTLQRALGRGFRSHEIEFTIKGWCPGCAG